MQTIHYNISDKKALSTPDKPVLVAGESGTSEIVLSTVPAAWTGFEVRALLTTPARILVDAFAVGNGFLLTNTMLDAQGYLYIEFAAYRNGTEIDRSLPDKLYVNAGRKTEGDIDPAPLPDLVAEMVAAKGDCDGAAAAAVLATQNIGTTDADVKAAEAIREAQEAARVEQAEEDHAVIAPTIAKVETVADVEIVLPAKLIAVVGHEFNIYNDNVILCDDPQKYEIRWGNSGGLGTALSECYRLTPIANNVGATTLTLGVYRKDTGALIASKTASLRVIAQTVWPDMLDTGSVNYVSGTKISGVSVGSVFTTSADSNIAYYLLDVTNLSGKLRISLSDNQTTQGVVVLDSGNKGLRSACTAANIRANAYSWSVYDPANDCFTVDLGVLKTSYPTFAKLGINFYIGGGYANYIKGRTPKVIFIGDSLTDAGYYPAEVVHMGDGAVTSLGTRSDTVTIDGVEYTVSHEGRVSWSAVNYVSNATYADKTNAFWNPATSHFDFSYYMAQQGYTSVDYVFINLGTNDTDTLTAIAAIDEMIASIHAFNANIKVVISLINPPVGTQDGWGLGKGVNGTRDVYKRKQLGFVKEYVTAYEDKTNIDVASIYTAIDTINDFESVTVAVSARNPLQVSRQNNTVHPSVYGYLKFADVYWNYLNL